MKTRMGFLGMHGTIEKLFLFFTQSPPAKSLLLTCFALSLSLSGFTQAVDAGQDSLRSALKKLGQDTFRVNTLNQLAKSYLYSTPDSCIYFGQRAVELATRLSFPKGKALGWCNIALGYGITSRFVQATNYTQLALNLYRSLGDKSGEAFCLGTMGNIYTFSGDLDKSTEFLMQSLKINEEIGNKAGVAKNNSNLGANFMNRGDVETAIRYMTLSLEQFRGLGNKDQIANLLASIGRAYFLKNNEAKALMYLKQGLDEGRKRNDKKVIGSALSFIGYVYAHQDNFMRAEECYLESLEVFKSLNDIANVANVEASLGMLYTNTKEYKRAIEVLEKTKQTQIKVRDLHNLCIVYQNIGDCYFELKDQTKAMANYEESLRLSRELKNDNLTASALRSVAEVLLARGEAAKALELAKESYSIAQRLKSLEDVAFSAVLISKIYERQQNFSEALLYLKANMAAQDSLDKQENKQEIGRMQAEFEYEKEITALELEKKNNALEVHKADARRKLLFAVLGLLVGLLSIIIVVLWVNQKRILMAREQAQLASKSKSEFLANMSHEIRTPLNGVIGFTDLLVQTELADNQKQYVATIHQSASSLLGIINDILDFSKIEAGKLDVSIQPTRLDELCKQVHDVVSFQVLEKGLSYSNEILDGGAGVVMADQMRLRQVLVNLMGNAVKFTEKGSISLSIKHLHRISDGLHMYRFSVTDTGVGINKANQEKIFEAFEQEDASTTRKFGGTGLGLAISNKILALMGSKLKLTSEPKEGSTFYFDIILKAAKEEIAHAEPINTTAKEGQREKTIDGEFIILIAEDNSINLLLTNKIVRKFMPQALIIEARNGRETVEIVKQNKIDLVFMDVQMPEMNGLEATKAIRREQGNRPYIIALTAGNVSGEMEACMDAGMNDFVSKPIISGSIEQALARWRDEDE